MYRTWVLCAVNYTTYTANINPHCVQLYTLQLHTSSIGHHYEKCMHGGIQLIVVADCIGERSKRYYQHIRTVIQNI